MQIPANTSLMSNPQAGNAGAATNNNRSPSESGAPGNPEGAEARGTRDANGPMAGGESVRDVESARPVEEAGRSETENSVDRSGLNPGNPEEMSSARPEQENPQSRPMQSGTSVDTNSGNEANNDDPQAQRLEEALDRSGARDGSGERGAESSGQVDLQV